MNKNLGTALSTALFVVLLSASLSFHTYRVIENCQTELLWNSREAYLFVPVIRRGYRFSYLKFLLEYVKEYFLMVPLPEYENRYTLVLRITPSAAGTDVQRFTAENMYFENYDIQQGSIYGYTSEYANRSAWRWTGERFERARPGEAEIHNDIRIGDFTNVQGWSLRRDLSRPSIDGGLTIEVGGTPLTFVEMYGGSTSIDIVSPNRHPKQILFVDHGPRKVSGAEYKRMFPPGSSNGLGLVF